MFKYLFYELSLFSSSILCGLVDSGKYILQFHFCLLLGVFSDLNFILTLGYSWVVEPLVPRAFGAHCVSLGFKKRKL